MIYEYDDFMASNVSVAIVARHATSSVSSRNWQRGDNASGNKYYYIDRVYVVLVLLCKKIHMENEAVDNLIWNAF